MVFKNVKILLFSCLYILFTGFSFGSDSSKIMLLIEEKNLGSLATNEVESLAISNLIENDFDIVDQEMVRANLKKEQKMLKIAGDTRGAVSLGLQFGADIIIVGEAVAKPSAKRIGGSNLRSYQAVVTLKAIQTDNSKTIASASEDATVIGLEDITGSSKALKAAGQKTLDKLIPDLKNTVIEKQYGSNYDITLTIGGVDQIWKLKSIRDLLRSKNELKKVTQKSYTAGVVIFDIESTLEPEILSEFLVINRPKRLKFQVLNISHGKIALKAVEA